MQINTRFYSYFKEIVSGEELVVDLPEGSTLGDLLEVVFENYPKLREMRQSTLKAVGVEYQKEDYVLHNGDQVSLFPPVQGG